MMVLSSLKNTSGSHREVICWFDAVVKGFTTLLSSLFLMFYLFPVSVFLPFFMLTWLSAGSSYPPVCLPARYRLHLHQ